MICEAVKYKGKWSVYFYQCRCYFFIGKGKRFCEKKAKEFNEEKIYDRS